MAVLRTVWPRPERMITSVCFAVFALCVTDAGSAVDDLREEPDCDNVLIFETAYENGTAKHTFKLLRSKVVFTGRNDCAEGTLEIAPAARGIDISIELGFFRKQWSKLREMSSESSLAKMSFLLCYRFDPYEDEFQIRLTSAGRLIMYFRTGEEPIINGAFRSDELVQAYSRGVAFDDLRRNVRTVAQRWRDYCRRGPSTTRTTTSPRISVLTGIDVTTAIGEARAPDTTNSAEGGPANALSAGKTRPVVTVVVLVITTALVVLMAWRWRGTLRSMIGKHLCL